VSTQAKISYFENPTIKIDLLYPKAIILYNESKHNILDLAGKAKKSTLH
jgi:hypothetical protein